MQRSKIALLLFGLFILLVLAACSQSASTEEGNKDGNGDGEVVQGDPAADVVLRLAHGTATNSLYHAGSEKFKELIEEKTDGKVTVEIHSDGQLGHDREIVDGMGIGTIEMGMVGVEPVTTLAPKLQVVNLPYVFTDRDTAYSVLDGEIGSEMVEHLPEKSGIRILGYFDNGFRHVSNSQGEINDVSDLRGLAIRTPESPVSLAIFRAFGANPTPMSFGELYTGLQQGTVDGQENPVSLFYTSGFYEIQDHLALTRHMYSPMLLAISEQKWASLSPEIQDAIVEASKEARDYERNLSQEQEEEYIEKVKEEGVTITEPNLDPFIEETKEVYKNFENEFGDDFYKRVIEAVNEK
ncbi:TRAP dicarboxylate transporter, DctP subunit (plasmid) [Alkalihalophilus pseudofirmus OF4]|uniref:TRAP dicarboxylate transporter, DctP subunit n=1 Tax=Alkalihalophilus pseudofirmus (strain ATCC BAA-2126 / JCM 17055 / OF4) TaxID=398511 RepID=D3G1R9_ALKPO|nr:MULTISPECIES: TRAP transporter substrate-binding protein [Alkalihalophilus]ADC52295.1 TRAP dicarboxylate transporter, DctP subunit [Alkalihalophilus pseudofirmus OF4]MED1603304.1 TRAP transporter substrate-binding protein [Alkalihalophilus marmarensis]